MKKLRQVINSLGPGLITAALIFGPSKITISSKIGAEYGFQLLWVVVVAIFFMIVYTSMAARIGLATSQSILGTIKDKWGKNISTAIGVGVFLVVASFQTGNSIGVGIAMGELTNTSSVIWVVFFNVVAIILLSFRSFYSILERAMLVLITMMLIAFTITFLLVKPEISNIVGGLKPVIPPHSLGIITAFIASCFSIVAAFYQVYLIQEKKRVQPGIQVKDKSFAGIFLLGLLTSIVLICGATIVHPRGIVINSASDMASALEPVFGNYARVVFLCGLLGASFSSLMGNSTLGGTVLGDALGFGSSLKSKQIKIIITIIMVIGAVVAIIFGTLPIQLIIFAQTITIFIVPAIGIAIYLVANDKKLMGKHVNGYFARIAGAAGLLLVIGLAVQSFLKTFSLI